MPLELATSDENWSIFTKLVPIVCGVPGPAECNSAMLPY